MDLRNLPDSLDAAARIAKRRSLIEEELELDLGALRIDPDQIGLADRRNCEQMIGMVPVPVGIAGPLPMRFSSGETAHAYLPLATTEGALVASINRGCKAAREAGFIRVTSDYVGITRSIAFALTKGREVEEKIRSLESAWKKAGEATSDHLKILSYEIESRDDILFLTLSADTDEAMGMNMITIAAQAVATFLSEQLDIPILTVAGNVDSDKKPSARTKEKGRGYHVQANILIPETVVRSVLKSDSKKLVGTARAKLEAGSALASALGKNLHAANTIAALYLSTGQDVAHVVEGSLADTSVSLDREGIRISVDLPAILVGVRGGGVMLPAQGQNLSILLKHKTTLRPGAQLAETIGAAVLAGEVSLLAAQATGTLGEAHSALSRESGKGAIDHK